MIRAELLTEVSLTSLVRLVSDPNYGFQEKFNGERRVICKDRGGIRNWNREGEIGKPLPPSLTSILLQHPLDQFVLDVEIVKNKTLYLFDALCLGEESLTHETYGYREGRYHTYFDNFHPRLIPTKTVWKEEEKRHFVLSLATTGAEGIAIKDKRCAYRQGRSKQHFKFKFWKTLDAVVIGASPEGKNSVRIGVYDNRGKLQEVSGVSLCGKKLIVKKNDVVEVKYLYATSNYNIVQPSLLRKRSDKRAVDCTVEQLILNRNFM